MITRSTWLFAAAALVAGCDDPVQISSTRGAGAAGGTAPGGADPAGTPATPGDPENPGELGQNPTQTPDAGALVPSYPDEAFVESEQNRDPFRSFAAMFKARPPVTPQRTVVMSTTAVEEMRLIAIISGVNAPRAMIVDRTGVGHVVGLHDFVGRPEVVQAGGPEGATTTLNWRVERIRPDQIVLTRDDPTSPGRPPLERVMRLDPGEEAAR